MLKIILKNIETGWYHCYPVKKEWESEAKKLKVGQIVQYHHKNGLDWEMCKVEKIIVGNPPPKVKGVTFSEFCAPPFNPGLLPRYLWCYPRKAGRATLTKKYLDDCRQIRLEHKEVEKYNEKPYFLARLDTIKGKPDGKENLEKMMFPCNVIWKNTSLDTDHLGQLVTGFPNTDLEYQLIDLGRQVPIDECCTVDRNVDLKTLMDRWHIEVIKGETQMYKIGGVNV